MKSKCILRTMRFIIGKAQFVTFMLLVIHPFLADQIKRSKEGKLDLMTPDSILTSVHIKVSFLTLNLREYIRYRVKKAKK